ncbi:MAG: ribose 5-phosphate isomerase B [Planctomycetes bacterium]|nr:ribose 5-phosphate isomerase B [Planctomycetota bacterium]
MIIVIGADHRGYEVKNKIAAMLAEMGHSIMDVGPSDPRSCDYTDQCWLAVRAILEGRAERGILTCGTGLGMSVTANKVPGIRAALCHDELAAQIARRYMDSNVLCLASDSLGEDLMRRIVMAWLHAAFEAGGRHERRVRKIALIEQGKSPLNGL